MPKCTRCKTEKPLGEFDKRKSKKGHLSWCKSCKYEVSNAARQKRAGAARPDTTECKHCGSEIKQKLKGKIRWYCNSNCKSAHHAHSGKRKAWNTENLDRLILYRAKARAKEKGLDFNLELEDCRVPEVCPVLGIPIEKQIGRGFSPNSPSLDRVDNSKGYIKGNVMVISMKANMLKNHATSEELRKIADWIDTTILEETV